MGDKANQRVGRRQRSLPAFLHYGQIRKHYPDCKGCILIFKAFFMEGTVKKSTGSWYEVIDHEGMIHKARIKGKFRLSDKKNTNPVSVGDHVLIDLDLHSTDATITELLPRKNY